jgi:hypothetical protein
MLAGADFTIASAAVRAAARTPEQQPARDPIATARDALKIAELVFSIWSRKPQQNGLAELFRDCLSAEGMKQHPFPSLAAARRIVGVADGLRHRASAQQPRRHGTRRVHQPPSPTARRHRS